MAVLKRFSYDNIVEHNPTAPDPVEGGGGSGGGGMFFVHVTGKWSEDDQQMTYEADKTFEEIMTAYNSGLFPAVIFNSSAGNPPTYILPCNLVLPLEFGFSDGAYIIKPLESPGSVISCRHVSINRANEVSYDVLQAYVAETT